MCLIGKNTLEHRFPKSGVARSIRAGGTIKPSNFDKFEGFLFSCLLQSAKNSLKSCLGNRSHSTFIALININNLENVIRLFRQRGVAFFIYMQKKIHGKARCG